MSDDSFCKTRAFRRPGGEETTPAVHPYAYIVGLAVFCAAVLCTLTASFLGNRTNREQERILTAYLAEGHAARISQSLDVPLQSAYTLEAALKQNGGRLENFSELARELLRLYPDVKNMALAPGGVIRQVEPLAGNFGALGHNLLEDPNRSKEARHALDTGKLALAGPFHLIQGRTAVIGRLPVFLPSPVGKSEFWGLVSVALSFPECLRPAGLDVLSAQGYSYRLWRLNPETDTPQILAESRPPQALQDPVQATVALPGTQWTLSVAPQAGWGARFQAPFILGLIIAALLGVLAFMLLNLSARKKQLERFSFTDNLTGLSNRRALIIHLEEAVERCLNKQGRLTLFFLGIDGFNQWNQTLGLARADELLCAFAERLKTMLGSNDMAARVGGDEFVLALHSVKDDTDCQGKLEELLSRLYPPYPQEGRQVSLSISIGIAHCSEDVTDMDMLLHRADRAMHRAKDAGGVYAFHGGSVIM